MKSGIEILMEAGYINVTVSIKHNNYYTYYQI